jgi:predicted nucleotidyltransferase
MTPTYDTDGKDVMFVVEYGSRLYGTNTATSDTDLKMIFLPDIDDVLLGKRMSSTKLRVDGNGVKITDDRMPMPANGVETEFIPFQTFARDFVQGQTYAVECAFAILNQGPSAPTPTCELEFRLVQDLVSQFANAEVYSMVSFAQKQTFDYVRRGERLNEAVKVQQALQDVLRRAVWLQRPADLRLDTPLQFADGMLALDFVARETGLPTSVSVNNNKSQRTLELNGRSYLESTKVEHILEQVNKLVEKYGERTTQAAETVVDFKSLSHAVRVYQQSIELLETGKITFPRPNVEELLAIKQGRADLEAVKAKLDELDAEVLVKQAASTFRKKTPELVAQAEQWLLRALRALYDLPQSA